MIDIGRRSPVKMIAVTTPMKTNAGQTISFELTSHQRTSPVHTMPATTRQRTSRRHVGFPEGRIACGAGPPGALIDRALIVAKKEQ